MSFKEKLNRYQEGKATLEEIEAVEKELSKYEAIEEYYADNLSAQLFESEEQIDSNETEGIQKVVNQRLRKVVLTAVLIVVSLYVGVFFIGSSIVDSLYYNPTIISQPVEEYDQRADFHYDLTAYVSLNMPGYSLSSASAESTSFGEYQLNYSLRNLFTNEEQLHFMNISRNRLALAYEGIFNHPNRFGHAFGFNDVASPYPEEASENSIEYREESKAQQNNITLEYLEELNHLSYLSMSIVFEEDLTMAQFYSLKEEYPELEFKWVGVRTTVPDTRWEDDQFMPLIGFSPNFYDEPSFSSRPDPEIYPYFYLEDFMSDEGAIPIEKFPEYYEKHFKSRLGYLKDQKEFIELFDASPVKVDFYEDALDYVNENGVETYGVLVYGTAEELLPALDNIPYESLYINDVLPTKPFIY